jgi:hypothetical protein
MAIIKLQVSVPEAVKAVAEFKQNRMGAEGGTFISYVIPH